MSADPTVRERIRSAVRQRETGDKTSARAALEELRTAAESSSTFDWLFFAHSFADVQVDPVQELKWDLTAFQAASRLTEAEALEEGVPGGRAGLLPSLHLNLADVYGRLGEAAWRGATSRRGARTCLPWMRAHTAPRSARRFGVSPRCVEPVRSLGR